MKHLPHLAMRVFDTPLLIAPQKLEVILGVLAPHLGLEVPVPVAAVAVQPASRKPYEVTPDGIAIIPVEGTLVHKSYGMDAVSGMRSYVEIQQEVEDAATDPAVKGILLDVDSPGGEVAGVFELADTIYAARSAKPIVAVANANALSGAYLLASCAQRVYSGQSSSLGSIGVIVSHLDVTGSDEKLGFKYTIMHAGARKADFNPHVPLSDEARATIEAELNRTYGMLVKAVARNRGLPEASVRETEAARYFGEDAVNVRLADRLGTRQDALADLRQAVGGPTISIRQGGRKTMQDEAVDVQAVDVEAIRSEARTQGYADAREIVELCALAGMPGKAAGLLAKAATPSDARQFLMEARATEDAAEIRSHVMPETGTGVKTNPESGPVMKAVERLAAKGVN
ncbi:MAG: S49 family peptidase [Acidobacteria bacterium]|nr:S49 family peptidase [Acidobacteriota bacterium]